MQAIDTQELLARNKDYSKTHISIRTGAEQITANRGTPYEGTRPPIPVVISCLDSRIIPDQFFKLSPSEVTVIRNVGGRVNDSIILQIAALSTLRPVGDILVIHHVDCGATKVREEWVRAKLTDKYGQDIRIDSSVLGAIADLPQSLRDDVEILRMEKLIDPGTRITGLLYDIKTGLVEEVCKATK